MDSTKAATKRHCFIEEDDGLASIVDIQAGFSGNNHQNNHHYPLISRPLYYSTNNNSIQRRTGSFRNVSSGYVSSPRSGNIMRFYEESHQPHFLDSCFRCKKPLGDNKDIFMYR